MIRRKAFASCGFLFLLFLSMAVTFVPVYSAGTITDCSTYGPGAGTLQDALSSGGTITFGCSGTIIVPAEIIIDIDTTIDGSGQNVILDGGGSTRILGVTGPPTVILKHLTLQNGSAAGQGGAISSAGTLSLIDTVVKDNTGASAGAIYNSGTLALTNSTVTSNVTNSEDAGGIYNAAGSATLTDSTVSNNYATNNGGGIANYGSATLTVSNSTISGNGGAQGGGIFNSSTSIVTVTNSTISGNGAVIGGGMYVGGTVTVTNSTISGNLAGAASDILTYASLSLTNVTISGNSRSGLVIIDGTVNLTNSIIAHHFRTDCFNSGTINVSHSLIMDGSCSITNGINGNLTGDPLLGTLTGSPAYFPLLAGSPAIDAGSNALAVDASSNPLTTDEAGQPRISNGTVDLGAYEFQVAAAAAGTPVSDLCQDVTALADNAITVSGGVQNVTLGGVVGNTYCRLIALDGSYVTSAAEIGIQSVLDLGVIDAVDVFGQLPSRRNRCALRQPGDGLPARFRRRAVPQRGRRRTLTAASRLDGQRRLHLRQRTQFGDGRPGRHGLQSARVASSDYEFGGFDDAGELPRDHPQRAAQSAQRSQHQCQCIGTVAVQPDPDRHRLFGGLVSRDLPRRAGLGQRAVSQPGGRLRPIVTATFS